MFLNPAEPRPGKATGWPERTVRALGAAAVAEPFGRLSWEMASEGRPCLPTEYSRLWFDRCTLQAHQHGPCSKQQCN